MSKDEIKCQINKVPDHFTDKAVEDLLSFLTNIENHFAAMFNANALEKILNEDKELLEKLSE